MLPVSVESVQAVQEVSAESVQVVQEVSVEPVQGHRNRTGTAEPVQAVQEVSAEPVQAVQEVSAEPVQAVSAESVQVVQEVSAEPVQGHRNRTGTAEPVQGLRIAGPVQGLRIAGPVQGLHTAHLRCSQICFLRIRCAMQSGHPCIPGCSPGSYSCYCEGFQKLLPSFLCEDTWTQILPFYRNSLRQCNWLRLLSGSFVNLPIIFALLMGLGMLTFCITDCCVATMILVSFLSTPASCR